MLNTAQKLQKAAVFFKERSATFGNNPRTCARIMKLMFPQGIKLSTEEEFARFQFLEHIINKVTRYSANFKRGGHADSSFDLSVYAMMLNYSDEVYAGEKKRSQTHGHRRRMHRR